MITFIDPGFCQIKFSGITAIPTWLKNRSAVTLCIGQYKCVEGDVTGVGNGECVMNDIPCHNMRSSKAVSFALDQSNLRIGC